jgi:hypothetical protein
VATNPNVKKQQERIAASSARTVTVACKIPTGMKLQLQKPVERMEDGPLGPKPKTYWAFYGKPFYVHGPSYPVGTIPKGFPKQPINEGGYALTPGIPLDFWEQWLEQNKNSSFVVPPDGAERGMIYADEELESVVAVAREHEKMLSGMEPISQDMDKNGRLTDPRIPTPMNNAITKLGFEPFPAGGG